MSVDLSNPTSVTDTEGQGDGTVVAWTVYNVTDLAGGLLNAAEVSVFYESGVFKMLNPSNPAAITYNTSTDGIAWTAQATSGLGNLLHPFVLKVGSTYYLYGKNTSTYDIDAYTSSDMIAWTLWHSAVLAHANVNHWDDLTGESDAAAGFGNVGVLHDDDGTWYLFYEIAPTAGSPVANAGYWCVGMAKSTNGYTFTRLTTAAPLLASGSGSIGGPKPFKSGGIYYLWAHYSLSGYLPTQGCRYRATTAPTPTTTGTWTRELLCIPRTTSNAGIGQPTEAHGQVADLWCIEAAGSVYLYHTEIPGAASGDSLGTPSASARQVVCVAPITLAQLLASDQALVIGQPMSAPQANLFLPKTAVVSQLLNSGDATTATEGVIWAGDRPFIHNFATDLFMGFDAGNFALTGLGNVGIGHNALHGLTSGASNTALGQSALAGLVSTSSNVGVGYYAGSGSTGTSNVFIGRDSAPAAAADNNSIVIGANATGLGTNTTVIGMSNTTAAKIFGIVTVDSLKATAMKTGATQGAAGAAAGELWVVTGTHVVMMGV